MSKKPELRVGVLSDIHVPFQDKKATKMALEYLENSNLDKLVLLGDIADFLAVSRYGKSLHRRASLNDELEQTKDFLADVRDRFPKTDIIYTKGNHEDRWDRYVTDRAPEFGELGILRLPKVLELKKMGIKWEKDKFCLNGMIFYHGDGRCSRNAGYTATAWMNHFMKSCIIGHIHRSAVIYKRYGTGQTMVGVENPCLCELDPEYDKGGTCNWQHGGTLLLMNTGSHINTPYPFRIEGNKIYGTI
jgi:UDP-2,3-diacylglucosamine pyrophosphatase LpxH